MQPPIKIYTLSTCSHCRSTKKLLDECNVKYEFTDVDLLSDEEKKIIIEDVRKLNPHCTFPTIVIGNNVIVGFDETKIRKALGL